MLERHKKRTSSLRIEERNTAFFFWHTLGAAEVGSHTLVGAEVAIVLVARTVLGAGRLNASRTSKQLLTSDAAGDIQGFAPVLEVRHSLGNLLHLGLLQPIGPELEIDLDDVGSPVHRLLPVLLHRVGAGELVAEPRS